MLFYIKINIYAIIIIVIGLVNIHCYDIQWSYQSFPSYSLYYISNYKAKQGLQGTQKLSSLKLLKIQNFLLMPGIFTLVTIRNCFLFKF